MKNLTTISEQTTTEPQGASMKNVKGMELSQTKKSQFSLIEILVVTAIITILASLLLPMAAKARARARFTSWRGYARDMVNDDALMLHYDFTHDSVEGSVLNNKALGLGSDGYCRENYDGAITGASTVEGRWQAKNGLEFDGSNDQKVEMGMPVDVSTNDVTIIVWAKPSVNGRTILQQLNGTGRARNLMRTNNRGKLVTSFGGGSTSTRSKGTLNEWNHYVLTHSATTNELKLYLNGELEKTTAKTGEACTGALRIGQNKRGHSKFKGVIDEVAIYNRELSADEIAEMFKTGRP